MSRPRHPSTVHADFAALVQAHGDDLYRYARWLCRDPHRAQDLVQEALLRGWRGFAALRDADATRAWLVTTLRREYFRYLMRLEPYDGVEDRFDRETLLAKRAADINRGFFPESPVQPK